VRSLLASSDVAARPRGRLAALPAALVSDLPSNRLAEISVRVRQVCDKYDLPYTTGSLLVQYGKAWRTIAKRSLPNKYLSDPADDAPETRIEKMFAELEPAFVGTDPAIGAG
jgi:NADPH-dependent stearoyl-CoA 9-desaturase